MNVELILTSTFLRDLKKLKRKYPSLKQDMAALQKALVSNPNLGTTIKENISKIRLAIRSKGKGKSGGARVIAHHEILIQIEQHTIRLLAIYDKSDRPTISDADIRDLLAENDLD